MSELHPTKTRLALLQAVADGAVAQHRPALVNYQPYAEWDRGPGVDPRYRRVTGRVDELCHHGWIELGPKPKYYKEPRPYVITAVGESVLGAKNV